MSVSTTCRRYVVVDSRNKHVCGKPASVIPAIDLYADRSLYPDAPPATMLLGLSHCAECAAMTTIEDLLDDAGWANVSATFMGLRRATPKLSDAVLHWHPVDGEVVKAWQASVDATTARIEREQRHRDN